MNNEYIIINKTGIQQRIKELEKTIDKYTILEAKKDLYAKVNDLLVESLPLEPEIEKGIKQGLSICLTKKDWAYGISGSVKQDIREYFLNLKLDI